MLDSPVATNSKSFVVRNPLCGLLSSPTTCFNMTGFGCFAVSPTAGFNMTGFGRFAVEESQRLLQYDRF